MSQAEIAGRLVPSGGADPAESHVMRDFQLCSSEGRPVLLSSFRGQSNMVLVFTGEQAVATRLLQELELLKREFAEDEARILVIVPGSQPRASELKQSLGLDFETLADADGNAHRWARAEDRAGHLLAAVCVTDRFGEIFAAYKGEAAENLPSVAEILRWLDFINIQCPECGPSEWLD